MRTLGGAGSWPGVRKWILSPLFDCTCSELQYQGPSPTPWHYYPVASKGPRESLISVWLLSAYLFILRPPGRLSLSREMWGNVAAFLHSPSTCGYRARSKTGFVMGATP